MPVDKLKYLFHNIFGKVSKKIRKYPIIIRNEEVLKTINEPVIFACNHSNTHDYYTCQEVLKEMVNVIAAKDCVNNFVKVLFYLSGAVLIDRQDKKSTSKGLKKLISCIERGNNVLFFPEATWNLSPSKPMLPLRLGVVKLAALTATKIIPINFEYVEKHQNLNRETETIEKCIIQFGQPITVKKSDDILDKLDELRDSLATLRWKVWEENGEFKREDLSFEIYDKINELKTKTPLFKYDHDKETKNIYRYDDYTYNEYPLNRVYKKKIKRM